MADDVSELEQLQHVLSEREKELDALYRLAALFSRPVDDVRAVIRETARILRASMERPEAVLVEIDADGYRERCGTDRGHGDGDTEATLDPLRAVELYTARRTYSIEKQITISVASSAGPSSGKVVPPIDEREKHLVASTATLMADLLQRVEMDQVLRESTKTLQRQTAELERKNVTLREVLSQIEHEKKALLRDARAHVDMYVRPYLHEIGERAADDPFVRSRVDQIAASLTALFTSDDRRLVEVAHRLSPREVEICGLIRNGLTTKEISSFLHISETTVERHRNTIRRKLKLNRSKVNLTTYLRSVT